MSPADWGPRKAPFGGVDMKGRGGRAEGVGEPQRGAPCPFASFDSRVFHTLPLVKEG